MGLIAFYAYYPMSLVLDHCEKSGRFCELAADVLAISKKTPRRDYSLEPSENGILPEIQAPPATRKMLKGLISRYWVFGNKSNANILKSLISDEGCEQGCVLYKELDPEDYSSVSIRDLVWLLCCDAAFFPRHKRCGSTSCSRCSSTSQRDHRLRSHVWGNSHLWRKLVGDVAGFKLFSSDVVD
ncbi:probable GABA transporter 2 [Salvia hispanica]|uniref:probable GABA transporter 2 n=1 Tax=Salvia hispanica TaxID=49212 RepID=UPI002008F48C|nr:probable GABA transporter 2 [Salvia hispanica]